MANVNKVLLIGNLTRDPECRFTNSGTPVAEISLACNRSFTTENGERREETTYIDVTLWKRQAELAQQYLHKGKSVFVEGRLHLDSWQDKETGKNRNRLKVIGMNVQFLSSAGDRSPSSTSSPQISHTPDPGRGGLPIASEISVP